MKATLLLICFVILFVFSSILTLSPEEFEQGAEHNWNCLTLLSHQDNLPRGIAQFGVAVGLLALITSFIGVFFAVRTTAHRLLTVVLAPFLAKEGGAAQRDAKFDHGILIGVFASLWVLTWLNPSVMDLFGLIVAPLVAVFLFILPVAVLARARGIRAALRPSLLFVLGAGLLLLVSYRLGTLLKELL